MDDDFDEEEIDELLSELVAEEDAIEAGVPRPRFRATWRRGRLLILPHHEGLVEQGPVATVLGSQERGRRGRVLIADLAESHDSGPEGAGGWELTVTPLTAEPPSPRAVRALLDWSADVGYRRVWLPDRVVTHPSAGRFHSRAKVRCETCGTTWRNGGHGFWSRVSKYRCFPMSCQLCGGDLPVWEVERHEGPEILEDEIPF